MPQEYVDTTLLDGYAGGPHITVEQVGLANQGLYGADDYVLGTGKKAAAQILTNNSIRIFDAVYVIQGKRDVINANGYKDVSIANGSQGMNRNDIIVRRYEKDESSEIEKTSYAVIKGVPVSGVATDPEVTVGDIKNGATLHEMALYRVRLNGLNIVGIDPLYKTLVNMSEIQEMLADLNSKLKSNTVKKKSFRLGNYDIAGYGVKYVEITNLLKDKIGENAMDRIISINLYVSEQGSVMPYMYESINGNTQWVYMYNNSASQASGVFVKVVASYV